MKVIVLAIKNHDEPIFVKTFSSSANGSRLCDNEIVNFVSNNFKFIRWNSDNARINYQAAMANFNIDEAVELILEDNCLEVRILSQEVLG